MRRPYHVAARRQAQFWAAIWFGGLGMMAWLVFIFHWAGLIQ